MIQSGGFIVDEDSEAPRSSSIATTFGGSVQVWAAFRALHGPRGDLGRPAERDPGEDAPPAEAGGLHPGRLKSFVVYPNDACQVLTASPLQVGPFSLRVVGVVGITYLLPQSERPLCHPTVDRSVCALHGTFSSQYNQARSYPWVTGDGGDYSSALLSL